MPKNIQGVMADRRTTLNGVLENWILTNTHVANEWSGIDAPWWYNERASLSVLAGAIWRAGGIAFEEYSEEKMYVHRHETGHKSYLGRCDLFFEIGSKEFIAEAKWGYSGATNDSDVTSRIKSLMKDARRAASGLTPNGQCR